MQENVSREEFQELRAFAKTTHHDKNNLALKMEGIRVEVANLKDDQWEASDDITALREAFASIRSSIAGIVAVLLILQTIVIAFVVYKVTH